MLERINLILKSRNLNAAQFADEIGVQRSSVSHILTGRNNASLDFLLKVLARYPEIDTDWLLTGKGVMIRRVSTGIINMTDIKSDTPVIATSALTAKRVGGDLFEQFEASPDPNKDVVRGGKEPDPAMSTVDQPLEKEVKQQKMPDEMVFKTDSVRHIEKIVIFYSDKTFGVYNPEA